MTYLLLGSVVKSFLEFRDTNTGNGTINITVQPIFAQDARVAREMHTLYSEKGMFPIFLRRCSQYSSLPFDRYC